MISFRSFLVMIAVLWGSLAVVATVNGQNLSTEGKDFWFGFMNNWDQDPEDNPILLEVYISAQDSTQGTLEIPNQQGFETIRFQVFPGRTTRIDLPTDIAMADDASGIDYKGIHLVAEDIVSVFAINKRQYSADQTVVLPTFSLSNEYLVMSHWEDGNRNDNENSNAQLLIVATEDETIVDITPSVNTNNSHPAGETFGVTLQQGHTYLLMADGDLTGTKIEARDRFNNNCNNIAVFAGNQYTQVGECDEQNGHDHLFAQMYPIKTWGQEYITVNYEPRDGGDIVKIMAAQDNTTVNVAGEMITLNAREYVKRLLDNVNTITSDKPIAVGQFSRTEDCDNSSIGDPFLIMLSPNEQLLSAITFNAPGIATTSTFSLNLIAPNVGLDDLTLDGAYIGSSFSPVPGNTAYSYARTFIGGGNHRIVSSEGFIAYVYGYGNNESFGYSAGANLSNLSLNVTIRNSDGELVNQLCKNELLSFAPLSDDDYELYEWDFGDGTTLTSTNQDPVYHSYEEEGAYTLELTGYSEETSCIGGGEQTEIRQLEVINPVLPVFGPRSVCPDTEEVFYYTENPDNLETEWLVDGGAISEVYRDSVRIDWGATNADAALYLRATQKDNGCTGDSVIFPVRINLRLDPAAPMGADSVCLADPDGHEYRAFYFQGSVYDWQVSGGEITAGQGEQSVLVNWNDEDGGKIWYKQSVPGEDICEGISDTLTVFLERSPDQDIAIVPTSGIYQIGEPIELSLVADSLYEYATWLLDGEVLKDSVSIHEKTNLDFSCAWSYQVEVISFHDGGPCTDSARVSNNLTIIPPRPEIIQVTNDTAFAFQLNIAWQISDEEYGDFERTLIRRGNRGIFSFDVEKEENQTSQNDVNPQAVYEYQFSMSDQGCEDETLSIAHSNMVLNASIQQPSNEVSLDWNSYEGWQEGVETYELYLSVDGGPLTFIDNTHESTFLYQEEAVGFDYCFRILAWENRGNGSFSWSNQSCVFFAPELYAYNVFTPNGDGFNPTFVIDNVMAYKNSKLVVADRNGNTVFEQVNYQNDWDGGELPAGVYYYVLELNEPRVEPQMINGYVQIMR